MMTQPPPQFHGNFLGGALKVGVSAAKDHLPTLEDEFLAVYFCCVTKDDVAEDQTEGLLGGLLGDQLVNIIG